jgi:hypothetical protein
LHPLEMRRTEDWRFGALGIFPVEEGVSDREPIALEDPFPANSQIRKTVASNAIEITSDAGDNRDIGPPARRAYRRIAGRTT